MKTVELHFTSGKAFLHSYWKEFATGGVLVHDKSLVVGEDVTLAVTFGQRCYPLHGRVMAAGRKLGQRQGSALVACVPPHDNDAEHAALGRALAAAQRTPRKFPRPPAEQAVTVWSVAEPGNVTKGRLVNLSAGGCEVVYEDDLYDVGDAVVLRGYDFEAEGIIRWCDNVSTGVEFKRFD